MNINNSANPKQSTFLSSIVRWFDSEVGGLPDSNESLQGDQGKDPKRINWLRCMPFIIVHLACFGVIWTGWSVAALLVCLGLFWLRMFAITAFYHRLLSHRSYKTNRFWQFVFAVIGNSSCQRGPL